MEPLSLRMVKTPRLGCLLALLLLGLLVLAVVILIYTPWQQSVKGVGKVTVFHPMSRPQTVEAQIPGRVVSWKVLEGQSVRAGQLLLELEDVDSKFLDPAQASLMRQQRQALLRRRQAAESREAALARQLEAMLRSQEVSLPMASVRNQQTEDRVLAAQQSLRAATQSDRTAQLNLERLEDLHRRGLRSTRDLELAQLEAVRTATEVERAEAALHVAEKDRQAAGLDVSKVLADTSAAMAGVEANLNSVRETVASIDSDLRKLEIDLGNLKARNRQQQVLAPSDGRVVRLLKVGRGETVKPGDVLATVVPETRDQAVELFVSQDDAPLVAPGRPVRLVFAGFPALQFSGWPSATVGTFAGRVAVVDALDDGSGRYRLLVRPDETLIASGRDEPWPDGEILRVGSAASGWVMLDTVPLYYELWRRWNAFPPNFPSDQKSSGKAPAEPKRSAK